MKQILIALLLTSACSTLPPQPPIPPGPPVQLHLGVVGAYHGPLDDATLKTLAGSSDLTLRAAVTSVDQAKAIAASVLPYPTLHVVWLVEGVNGPLVADLLPVLMVPPTTGIELGNELDLAGLSPAQFGAWIKTSHSALRANGYTGRIISGGIYTTQPRALKYLVDAGVKDWPSDVVVGLHRYGDPDSGVDGYPSRDAETNAILSTAAGHGIAFTEFGYPTFTAADEAWAANAVLTDLNWFRKARAQLATEYQYTDGPGTSNLDHFGIRTFDGRWKPVSVSLGIPMATGPPATLAFDLVACNTPFVDNYCAGPAGATFAVEVATNVWKTFTGDGNGYVFATGIPNVPDSHLIVKAAGYEDLSVHISPPVLVATNAKGIHNAWELISTHIDPSGRSLESLAAIRGGMWPQTIGDCNNLPIGPRPGDPTNIIATDFITEYNSSDQLCIINALKARGYTHVVMGPLVDSDGYHGIWTPNDWRGANFDKFLDAIQLFWDHGLATVVFIHPDGWTFEQTRDELTPLLQQPRAQKLIRIVVPTGWEPTQYGWSSCTWAAFGQWARGVLPNALVLLHTVADVDAPVGTDERCDDNGKPNADGWKRVAPFFHGWLTQSNAFDNPTGHGDPNHPEKTNFDNWQDNYRCSVAYSYCNRFHNGYSGWPTFSAWTSGPIRIYAGEYSAYWRFWAGRLEAEGVAWGDAAMAAGADGYLDSGSVAVTIH